MIRVAAAECFRAVGICSVVGENNPAESFLILNSLIDLMRMKMRLSEPEENSIYDSSPSLSQS
jgi:hypothetical protein